MAFPCVRAARNGSAEDITEPLDHVLTKARQNEHTRDLFSSHAARNGHVKTFFHTMFFFCERDIERLNTRNLAVKMHCLHIPELLSEAGAME
jgi:hypothetical protein